MGCSSCAEQRRALVAALARGQVKASAQIAVNGVVQIAKQLSPMPRKTKPKFTKA